MDIKNTIIRSCENAGEFLYRATECAGAEIIILDSNGEVLHYFPDDLDDKYFDSFVVYDKILTTGEGVDLCCKIINDRIGMRGSWHSEAMNEIGIKEICKTALPQILADVVEMPVLELLMKYGIPDLEAVEIDGNVMLGCHCCLIWKRIFDIKVLTKAMWDTPGESAHFITNEMSADVEVRLFSEKGVLNKKIVCKDWLAAAEYYVFEFTSQNFDSNRVTEYDSLCLSCGRKLEGRKKYYCSEKCKLRAKMQRYRQRKKLAPIYACDSCKKEFEDGAYAYVIGDKKYCSDCIQNSMHKLWGNEWITL